MPKKFLTVKEVSRLFGVTPLTIRNWDKRGKLAAYRHPVNNYRLYKTEDIEAMMKDIEDSRAVPASNYNVKMKEPRMAPIAELEAETEEEKPAPSGPKKLEIDIL